MCGYSFCSKCILRWAEKDSRCPACRGRFRSVTEKLLDREQPALGCTNDEEMKHSKQMLGKVIKVHDIPERNQVRPQSLTEGVLPRCYPIGSCTCHAEASTVSRRHVHLLNVVTSQVPAC